MSCLLTVTALLAIAAAGGAQTSSPPAQESNTGAISGTIVDGNTGQPVAGAVVTLSTNARGTTGFIGRVSTDSAGRFVFLPLPASSAYFLSAARFGYFDGSFGQDTAGQRAGRRIELADGQWLSGLRVTLWRPATVSGTVTDEAGEPVVGTYVRVLPLVNVAGLAQPAAGPVTTTDDRGMYHIAGLTAGKYIVSLPSVQAAVPAGTSTLTLLNLTPDGYAGMERAGRAPALPARVRIDSTQSLVVGTYVSPPPPPRDRRPQAYPPVFHPTARRIADALPVELRFGENRGGVDFQLRPEATARVSGRVIGPPDALAGLTLRLVPIGSEGLGHGSEVATALVGENGAFTLLNVPAGEYTLIAARSVMEYHFAPATSNLDTELPPPPGYRQSTSGAGEIPGSPPGTGYSYSTLPGTNTHWGRLQLTIGARDVDDLIVELRPTVAIRGRLIWEGAPTTINVRGVNPSGAVTSRPTTVPMYADPADGDASLGMPNGRYSLDTQEFSIEGLRAGAYRIRLMGAPVIKSMTWNGRDYTHRAFDAADGRDFDGVVMTITDQVATIRGEVRDERGNSLDAAAVIAFPTDRTQWTHYGFSPARIRSVQMSSGGTFSVTLPAGEYGLVAVDAALSDNWRDPAFLARVLPIATTIRVDWGETKTQALSVKIVK